MAKTMTIAGAEYTLPSPEETGIVAGFVLDEAAAKHLYQTRNERIRNNIAPTIRKMKEKGTSATEIAEYVMQYARDYKFSMLGRGSAGKAPNEALETEQYAIARDYIKQYLAEQGRKPTDIPDGMSSDEWDAKLHENVERVASNPDTIKLAKKRLAERQRTASTLLSGVAL
jgi:hypothetical protein